MEGFKEIDKKLKRLQGNDAKKALRNSTNAGAADWVKSVKAKVPAGYNTLKKAITKKQQRTQNKDEVIIRVGYTQGRNARYDAFYGHMVEFGISQHDITPQRSKSGELIGARAINAGDEQFYAKVTVGPIPAKPFLRPATSSAKTRRVEKAFAEKLMSEIKRFVAL